METGVSIPKDLTIFSKTQGPKIQLQNISYIEANIDLIKAVQLTFY